MQRLVFSLTACSLLELSRGEQWSAKRSDETALLQTSTGLTSPAELAAPGYPEIPVREWKTSVFDPEAPEARIRREPVDPCVCRNWKGTYNESLVGCGEGLELMDPEMDKRVDVEFCNDFPTRPHSAFFKYSDHRFCINVQKVNGPGRKRHPGSWCYVSAECEDLHGGKKVNAEIAYKRCRNIQGEALADLTPKQLFNLTGELAIMNDNVDYQLMASMAYEWAGPEEDDEHPHSITDVAYDASQRALIGTNHKPDTLTVVYKNEVWEVDSDHPPTCVSGCAVKDATDATDATSW